MASMLKCTLPTWRSISGQVLADSSAMAAADRTPFSTEDNDSLTWHDRPCLLVVRAGDAGHEFTDLLGITPQLRNFSGGGVGELATADDQTGHLLEGGAEFIRQPPLHDRQGFSSHRPPP